MKGRIFTPEFKLSVVRAVLSGQKSVVQLCRENTISDSCIYNWKKLYREKGEAAFTAPTIARCSWGFLHNPPKRCTRLPPTAC